MAGHPSVKKRQKEVARKERQADKLARRDERRTKRTDPAAEVGSPEWLAAELANAEAAAPAAEAPNAPAAAPAEKPVPAAVGKP